MSTGIEPLINPDLAPVFGPSCLAAQFVWPFLRKRDAILSLQLAASRSYATTYALLGQQTATAVCLAGAIQTTIALLAGDRPWLSLLGYAFLPFAPVIGFITYSGLPTFLAVTDRCIIMIGRLRKDTLWLLGIQLTASPFGAALDVIVGAWPALAGAVVSFTLAFTTFRRELRISREQSTCA